jgi:hypothetical protein
MDLIARLSLIFCGSLVIIFGTVHLFFPKFFRWEKSFPNISNTLASSIMLNNFVLSISFICLGIQIVLLPVLFWDIADLVVIQLLLGILLIIARIIYELINPLPIKNKIMFRIFTFIILLLLFTSFFIKLFYLP